MVRQLKYLISTISFLMYSEHHYVITTAGCNQVCMACGPTKGGRNGLTRPPGRVISVDDIYGRTPKVITAGNFQHNGLGHDIVNSPVVW